MLPIHFLVVLDFSPIFNITMIIIFANQINTLKKLDKLLST